MTDETPIIDTAAAAAAGVQLEEEVYEDYFGFDERHVFFFPDGKQYIEYQAMNEGARAKFQKSTNKDVVVERASGNARMKVDPASERQELLKVSVTGWHLMRRNDAGKFQPVPFSKGSPGSTFEQWLAVANPKIVEQLEIAVRKANPWLLADQSSEEIRREIETLEEAFAAAVKRETGEGSSASK
jgi:hypothetical protein